MGFIEKTLKHRSRLSVAAAILAYTVVMSWYTVSKHNSFSTYAWDLGIFDQSFWTTVNLGMVFYNTCEQHLVESGSFFGVHFSPILFLLVPFYYLHQSPVTLLVLQSLILGLSAYPIYLIAKTRLPEETAAALAMIYLLNPALHGVNSYDFHVQSTLPLIFNYLLLYTLRWDTKRMVAASILALSVQEQVVVVMLSYVAFLVVHRTLRGARWREKAAIRGEITPILAVLAATVIWWAMSSSVLHHYNPDVPKHLMAGQNFAILEVGSPAEVPLRVLTDPGKAFRAVSYDWFDKNVYALSLFTPTLFLGFLSPATLIPAAPWFAVSALSNYPPYYRLGFQYPALVLPFIYVSLVMGLERLSTSLKEENSVSLRAAVKGLLVVGVASCVALSPLSPFTDGFSLSPAYIKPAAGERSRRLTEMLALIPPEASVLTQDNVFPHVSGRLDAYVMVPEIAQDPETWRRANSTLMALRTEYILLDMETDPHGTAKTAFQIVAHGNYSLLAFYDNIYLYERGGGSTPLFYEPISAAYGPRDLIVMNAEIVREPNSTTGEAIRYVDMHRRSSTIWYGPYEIAPEGRYTALYRLKTSSHSDTGVILLDARSRGETLANVTVDAGSLPEGAWHDATLNFTLNTVSTDLELRGILLGDGTDILLDGVRLTQR
jgi:uncharacterized membrane protein